MASSEEEGVYTVQCIVAKRTARRRGGKVEYLVRWEGYGSDDDTWEPAHALAGTAKQAVAAFEKGKAKPASRRESAAAPKKPRAAAAAAAGASATAGSVQEALDQMDDNIVQHILEKLALRWRLSAAMTTKGFLRAAFAPTGGGGAALLLSERARMCCSGGAPPSREELLSGELLSATLPPLELWIGAAAVRSGKPVQDKQFSLTQSPQSISARDKRMLLSTGAGEGAAFRAPTTPKGNAQALKGVIAVGGGTAIIEGKTRWLGENHVRGVTFADFLEIDSGHTRLVGCILNGGVTIRAHATLTLVSCRVVGSNDGAWGVVCVGKGATLQASDTTFTDRDGLGYGSDAIRAQGPLAVVIRRCRFTGARHAENQHFERTALKIELGGQGRPKSGALSIPMKSLIVEDSSFGLEHGLCLLRGDLPPELSIRGNDFSPKLGDTDFCKHGIVAGLQPTPSLACNKIKEIFFINNNEDSEIRMENNTLPADGCKATAVNGVKVTLVGTAEQIGTHALKAAASWGERDGKVEVEIVGQEKPGVGVGAAAAAATGGAAAAAAATV